MSQFEVSRGCCDLTDPMFCIFDLFVVQIKIDSETLDHFVTFVRNCKNLI